MNTIHHEILTVTIARAGFLLAAASLAALQFTHIIHSL